MGLLEFFRQKHANKSRKAEFFIDQKADARGTFPWNPPPGRPRVNTLTERYRHALSHAGPSQARFAFESFLSLNKHVLEHTGLSVVVT